MNAQPQLRRREKPINHAQLKHVLEIVSEAALTLDKLTSLLLTEELDDSYARGAVISASNLIARSVGAMADSALDAGVHGDADRWFFGPLFHKLGERDDA